MIINSTKIGHKILLVVGIVSTIILMGMMAFYTRHEEQAILTQYEQARHDLLRSVISTLRSVMLTGSARIAQNFADRLKDVPDILDFRIMRPDGVEAFRDNKTLTHINEHLGREAFAMREEEDEVRILPADHATLTLAVASHRIQSYQDQDELGEERIHFLAPILNDRECYLCHGEDAPIRGVVKLTASLASVHQAVADARSRATRIMVGSLVTLLLLVYFLIQKSVIQPLTEITQAMAQVAEGDLTRKVPLFRDFELKKMASSFNRMIAALLHTHKGFIQERNKLSTIILSARDGIVVTDHNMAIVLVNPAAERLLGKTAQQIVQEGLLNLFQDPDHMKALLDRRAQDVPELIVFNERMLNINAEIIQNSDGEILGSAAMIRDVTEEKKLEESLRHLSYTDKLTGLFNRRRMEEILVQEFDRARRYGYFLSVMLFDVDHFKKFNDTYGHDQGDRVLAALGSLLRDHFRKTDFPCRYGGEEFCVILTSTPVNATNNGALIAAERFRQRVEKMLVDGLQVTISIGLAVYPTAQITNVEQLLFPSTKIATVEDLVKEADNALYQAKHQGRNQVVLAHSLQGENHET